MVKRMITAEGTNFRRLHRMSGFKVEPLTTQPDLHQSRAQDEPRGYPYGHPKVDQVLSS